MMLTVNLKNRAISQTNLPFNSATMFGDVPLATTPAGLVRIGGYNDAGVQIPGMIKSGMTDFGIANRKRVRFFYFGLETTGSLMLKIFCDGVLAKTYTVRPDATGKKSVRVPISRRYVGRYWSWSIENTNGAFFAPYSVQVLPVILHPNRGQ